MGKRKLKVGVNNQFNLDSAFKFVLWNYGIVIDLINYLGIHLQRLRRIMKCLQQASNWAEIRIYVHSEFQSDYFSSYSFLFCIQNCRSAPVESCLVSVPVHVVSVRYTRSSIFTF
jgi:hypothetical protein